MTKPFYIFYLFILTLQANVASGKNRPMYAEAELQARYLLCILQEAAESSYVGEEASQLEHEITSNISGE